MELTQQLKADFRTADVSPKMIAALEFADLLTREPSAVRETHVQALRDAGWSDEDIVDIVHETALFNYINRMALGLGVEIESFMPRIEERDRHAVDTSTWG
ncbi:MAG: hypothetical protein O3C25_01390 [Chloroflexi bacterium]|nr:hypothetical protein [Chloroflexota bacterium]